MEDPCAGCFNKDGPCGTPCTVCPKRVMGRTLVQIGNVDLPKTMICHTGDDNEDLIIDEIGPQWPILEAEKPKKKSWLEKKQRRW